MPHEVFVVSLGDMAMLSSLLAIFAGNPISIKKRKMTVFQPE